FSAIDIICTVGTIDPASGNCWSGCCAERRTKSAMFGNLRSTHHILRRISLGLRTCVSSNLRAVCDSMVNHLTSHQPKPEASRKQNGSKAEAFRKQSGSVSEAFRKHSGSAKLTFPRRKPTNQLPLQEKNSKQQSELPTDH